MEKKLSQFQFRGIHPDVFLGTCTDRYSGWIDQVYSGGNASLIGRRIAEEFLGRSSEGKE